MSSALPWEKMIVNLAWLLMKNSGMRVPFLVLSQKQLGSGGERLGGAWNIAFDRYFPILLLIKVLPLEGISDFFYYLMVGRVRVQECNHIIHITHVLCKQE